MKAYDITKLTAELKISDSIQYRNKIYCFQDGYGWRGYRKHRPIHTVNVMLPYEDSCADYCAL